MLAAALSLIASVSWGFAGFLAGVVTKRISGLLVVVASHVIGLVAVAGVVLVIGEGFSPEDRLLVLVGAGLASAIAAIALYEALALGRMGMVAPIAATGVIVPVVFGLLSGDRPSTIQGVGMIAAVLGVLLVLREQIETPKGAADSRLSIVLALLAALAGGLALVALAEAADAGSFAAVMWSRVTSVTVLLMAAIALGSLRVKGGAARTDPRVVAIGLLESAGISCFVVATTHASISTVAIASSLYPAITAVLARMWLGEKLRMIQVAGLVLILAGVGAVVGG